MPSVSAHNSFAQLVQYILGLPLVSERYECTPSSILAPHVVQHKISASGGTCIMVPQTVHGMDSFLANTTHSDDYNNAYN